MCVIFAGKLLVGSETVKNVPDMEIEKWKLENGKGSWLAGDFPNEKKSERKSRKIPRKVKEFEGEEIRLQLAKFEILNVVEGEGGRNQFSSKTPTK